MVSVDLIPEESGQFVDHHLEAGIHVLIHLGGHQNADCCQLDQVRRSLSLCGQNGEISVRNAHSEVECVLGVALDAMELLDERNHRLSVLWGDPQRKARQFKVVSNRSFLL